MGIILLPIIPDHIIALAEISLSTLLHGHGVKTAFSEANIDTVISRRLTASNLASLVLSYLGTEVSGRSGSRQKIIRP